jgi:hypothetical protein
MSTRREFITLLGGALSLSQCGIESKYLDRSSLTASFV